MNKKIIKTVGVFVAGIICVGSIGYTAYSIVNGVYKSKIESAVNFGFNQCSDTFSNYIESSLENNGEVSFKIKDVEYNLILKDE